MFMCEQVVRLGRWREVSSSRRLAGLTVGSDGVPKVLTFWAKGAPGPDPLVRDEGAW